MAVLSGDMAVTISPNPQKKAKYDRKSVKNILDETAMEIVESNGYVEDSFTMMDYNYKLLEGTVYPAIALFAQFYYEKFPLKLNQLALCYLLYLRGIPQLTGYLMGMHVFLYTYPVAKSCCTTGLALSSKLARSSDLYTLTIASAEPYSAGARPPVKLTKSFTEWFASDGELMEDLYRRDVEGLVKNYTKKSNESKWGLLMCMIPGILKMIFMLALVKLLVAIIH